MGMLMTLLANPPVPRTLWSLRTFGSLDPPTSPPLSPPKTPATIILSHLSWVSSFPPFFLESSPSFYNVFRFYSRLFYGTSPLFYHVASLAT